MRSLGVPIVVLGVVLGRWAEPAWGQVDLSAVVTPIGGGMFHYDYTITNNLATDVLIVSLNVPPDPSAVINLMFPTDYIAVFDPGLGFVDFVEDAQPFAAGTGVAGFAFDSAFGPGTAGFSAFDVGLTTAPVPEPTTALLAAVAALSVVGRRRGKTGTEGGVNDGRDKS
jgi:hypothetical protein